MKRRRDLIVTNLAALLVLLIALLLGWREAAAFGLAVLVIMDLMVFFREWSARSRSDGRGKDGE
jgi:hypothetical protein